jgi:O-acetyl-ADP-ribose deacetylase (regulator of RNase III)
MTIKIKAVSAILTDITTLGVDAIVNAANEDMAGGGGVDGAIHRAAGPLLKLETIKHAPLYVAKTAITDGYNLKAKFIVHTVGPKYGHGGSGEYLALETCYQRAIIAAHYNGAKSIAIPAISAGVYGFPKDRAAKIAVEASMRTVEALEEMYEGSGLEVILVAYDKETLDLYLKYIKE